MSKAPCGGDAGMPDAPPSARPSKAAALAIGPWLAPAAAGARPLVPTTPRPVNPAPAPPFEPPEPPGRVA